MKLVIFGLTVSSTWGNGHATLWRGLIAALARLGHHVTFFERDLPYYAAHRDLFELPHGAELVLYGQWDHAGVARAVNGADAGIITSYCPDAQAASRLLLDRDAVRCFYDLDTPVTLDRLARGQGVDYIDETALRHFDLLLSYTGGEALAALRDRFGVRAEPLYGSVDPAIHMPAVPAPQYAADLSYLGTYAADRQHRLAALFVEPARQRPEQRFVIGGALYPDDFPWAENIHFVRHLPAEEHPAFYAASRLTLNVTRAAMARMGWCPSGRLFEAAACGAPILSDSWEGMDAFFEPNREILIARHTDDVLAAIGLSDGELARIAAAARERALTEHTAQRRATELVAALQRARHKQEA